MAAILALLSTNGILPASVVAMSLDDAVILGAMIDEQLVSRFDPPEAPPPRG
jgi:hypothetical protein